MEYVTIAGELREETGGNTAKKLREQDRVPCILYGGDEHYHFQIHKTELKELVYTPKFKLARLEVNGQSTDALLKDIQFHPVSDEILHVDFFELVEERKVRADVPIEFVGERESPGMQEGGALLQKMRRVKLRALPEYLIDEVTADISAVEMGGSVRIEDLDVADEVELISPPNAPIASVVKPRVLKMDLLPEELALLEEEEEMEEEAEEVPEEEAEAVEGEEAEEVAEEESPEEG